jgi:hypothetical protein
VMSSGESRSSTPRLRHSSQMLASRPATIRRLGFPRTPQCEQRAGQYISPLRRRIVMSSGRARGRRSRTSRIIHVRSPTAAIRTTMRKASDVRAEPSANPASPIPMSSPTRSRIHQASCVDARARDVRRDSSVLAYWVGGAAVT